MASEAQARITINKLLEEAGWRFLPDAKGHPENIICEHRITRQAFSAGQDLGRDFEYVVQGFVDYVLQDNDKRPVAVVEAKRESIDPLTGKEQARAYAESLGVSHIFLSNGLVHYYWNLRQGNPVKVSRFLPFEELGIAAEWQPSSDRLAAMPVDENYIAISQDATWLTYTTADRALVAVNKKIKLLRDYQIAAIHALQKAASPNSHRFLFEMATGTGKTLLSAAIAKLYLRSQNASRILFLVDRLELENQAWRNFNTYLANDGIQTVIYKQRRQNWKQSQVMVTTIQSLAARNRFLHEFAPTDFQLIISDEAHRTISGNNRAIFEYFVGSKLGLTATPRDYLKGVGTEDQRSDPREYERRLLLDTYRTFGSDDGRSTYRYTLLDAVQHTPPYLCNPVTLDARTDITTKILSDEGYAVAIPPDDDGPETEMVFGRRDYERKFFSEETNVSFVNCILDNAKCDPITGEMGKTIVFAVSRDHATKLVTLLNEEATRRWPNEYAAGSTFAVQVMSKIAGAQQMTIDFANNNLNGKSRWKANEFRDYDTSRTRVCVTFGMMTTGYDCEDILNIVMARPIFSPTDFIQIKGRGTRLYTFQQGHGAKATAIKKDNFALFDFFANCEFFENDFDYDKKLSLVKIKLANGGGKEGEGECEVGKARSKDFSNTSPDPISTVVEDEIGLFGMKIDREMYRERFAHQAKHAAETDEVLREAFDAENWPAVEERVRQLLFGNADSSWSLPKLQEIYKSDRFPSLREILARVFGLTRNIPTRVQLADEAFERFIATQETNATHSREMHTVFETFLLDEQSRELLEQGRFAELRSRDANLFSAVSQLADNERNSLIGYLQSQVPLREFTLRN